MAVSSFFCCLLYKMEVYRENIVQNVKIKLAFLLKICYNERNIAESEKENEKKKNLA